jgi:hypothetical protein
MRTALVLLAWLLGMALVWAIVRGGTKEPMPTPAHLGDVEADWAAIVADLRKEQE